MDSTELRDPPPLSDLVTRADLALPGDPGVTVRVHRPARADKPLPCVVSMHAGAYVGGDRFLDDELFQAWCPTLDVVGVSVEYRLAPAAPYPGPLMDCYVALKWVHEHANEIGADPLRIGLHGTEAGGGLAAALALVARDHREVPLAFQVLDSPMLDDRQGSDELAWRSYLGELYGADLPIYAAAARCPDLRRLPPTFVSVGALDSCVDASVDFATRLNHTGIPTDLRVYADSRDLTGGSDVVRRAGQDKTDWLRHHLGA